jgi:hypothetical protein
VLVGVVVGMVIGVAVVVVGGDGLEPPTLSV